MVLGLGFAYYYNPYNANVTEPLKSFGTAATIASTAISAIMTAIVSLITMHKNQGAAKELERLKGTIARTQEFHRAARQAYLDLLAAVDAAYAALQQLEAGRWATENNKTMAEALAKAATLTVHCRIKAHEDLWEKIRQKCIALGDRAEELGANKQQQPELWRSKVSSLATAIAEFKTIVQVETRKGIDDPDPGE